MDGRDASKYQFHFRRNRHMQNLFPPKYDKEDHADWISSSVGVDEGLSSVSTEEDILNSYFERKATGVLAVPQREYYEPTSPWMLPERASQAVPLPRQLSSLEHRESFAVASIEEYSEDTQSQSSSDEWTSQERGSMSSRESRASSTSQHLAELLQQVAAIMETILAMQGEDLGQVEEEALMEMTKLAMIMEEEASALVEYQDLAEELREEVERVNGEQLVDSPTLPTGSAIIGSGSGSGSAARRLRLDERRRGVEADTTSIMIGINTEIEEVDAQLETLEEDVLGWDVRVVNGGRQAERPKLVIEERTRKQSSAAEGADVISFRDSALGLMSPPGKRRSPVVGRADARRHGSADIDRREGSFEAERRYAASFEAGRRNASFDIDRRKASLEMEERGEFEVARRHGSQRSAGERPERAARDGRRNASIDADGGMAVRDGRWNGGVRRVRSRREGAAPVEASGWI